MLRDVRSVIYPFLHRFPFLKMKYVGFIRAFTQISLNLKKKGIKNDHVKLILFNLKNEKYHLKNLKNDNVS